MDKKDYLTASNDRKYSSWCNRRKEEKRHRFFNGKEHLGILHELVSKSKKKNKIIIYNFYNLRKMSNIKHIQL